MNEIKFRGKRLDNGEWVYGFLYRHSPPLQCFASEKERVPTYAILKTGFADWNMPRPIEQHDVDGKTVGQFIGVTDKNNKEIFTGDIVKCNTKGKIKWPHEGAVEYLSQGDGFCCAYFGINCGKNLDDQIEYTHFWNNENFEITGNIYENPEFINS